MYVCMYMYTCRYINFSYNNCTSTESIPSVCSEGQFICSSGICIPETWVCDGDADCSNAEDEIICSKQCTLTLHSLYLYTTVLDLHARYFT